nr:hypothetical protein [Tanacetum cinerariifolium]
MEIRRTNLPDGDILRGIDCGNPYFLSIELALPCFNRDSLPLIEHMLHVRFGYDITMFSSTCSQSLTTFALSRLALLEELELRYRSMAT